ncbi:MAG: alanine--tRNA ligase [Nostocaceae cyanobacterium]|nr:alanine--tRNA ligase [Nostocaceae cyanobacterium]
MNSKELRKTFIDYFQQHQHTVVASSALIPANDPTLLFTNAGMVQFKDVFLGQEQRPYVRATSSQRCVRAGGKHNDLENVGYTARHHTFFEMLGNFSFGDYFKSQAIAWGWEVSTSVFGLPKERLVVSVFEDDDEAFAIWRDQIGVSEARIKRMGADDNFWVSGPTGPCGPCSEIYYDFHPERGDENIDLEDDTRFIEFYNLVFMQYNRDADGNLTPLQNKNIDTGMGLERMAQILQQVPNNYETDLIFPILQTAAKIAEIDYATSDEKTKTSLKVIGDHIRAIVHMIADEIHASNVGRGYIVRRLIRRVVRHGRLIGISDEFTTQVAESAIALAESAYPNVRLRDEEIKTELQREESAFLKTLARGEKLLEEIIQDLRKQNQTQIGGESAFTLYDTYGFPLELTQEIAEENGLTVDVDAFALEMEKQKTRGREAREFIDLTVQGSLDTLAEHIQVTEFLGYSQASSPAKVEVLLVDGKSVDSVEAGTEVQIVLDQTPFYAESGGQVGDRGYISGDSVLIRVEDVKKESEFFVHFGRVERGNLKVGDHVTAQIDRACRRRVQANHTATHLLQAALKEIVNDSISQAGSLVAFDRLRFDFNCPRALTPEEVQQVEEKVNTWIAEAHAGTTEILPLAEAKARGATAMFGEKYGDSVRVLDFPGVSMELCGGTHVSNTAEIGVFKIVSETGVASGVRRIEAVAGLSVLDYLNVRDRIVRELSDRFKVRPEELPDRITSLQTEVRTTTKELEHLKAQLAIAKSDNLLKTVEIIGEHQILVAQMEDVDPESLKTVAERLLQKLGNGAVVLGSVPEAGKVSIVAAFSSEVQKKGLQAGKFVGAIAKICGGGGGGKPNLAQAGGRDASKLPEALLSAQTQLQSTLNP